MSNKTVFTLCLLLAGFLSFGQLYKKPVYPQGYFRWCTDLRPDIVANMGELRNNHWHMGLDVRTNQVVNQKVLAAADGYIAFVGIEPLSWGRWIIINHPNGLSTLYGHLNDFRDDLEGYVKQHQYSMASWETHLTIPAGKFPVKKGDFISFSGTTGGSGGPHVHWEVIDTKSGKRLNPTLFGTPIADNIAPSVLKIAMYDRSSSVFDQVPQLFKLSKINGEYTVAGSKISTALRKIGFSIQAYDTRSGTGNQDGIYSARLFVDDREISSFYIDSIAYPDSRYMNCQVDYKMVHSGGSWMQHMSKLPGDRSGVYYDLGQNNLVELDAAETRNIKIEVADANGNISVIAFAVENNGGAAPPVKTYDWLPGRPNKVFKPAFEAYLFPDAIYDKMNANYAATPSVSLNSVSARHRLGETYIPVHSNFEVRIKPEKFISQENRNKIVIKREGKNSTVKKAVWNGEWLTAQFRDFGSFEAFIDNVPPAINNLGSGDVVNLNKASRIVFTPQDNYGIDAFKAELDGEWLRFTNDKGRTWIYTFDERVTPGQHTLTVTIKDIAGNITKKSWEFVKGVDMPAATAAPTSAPAKTNVARSSRSTGKKSATTVKKTTKSKTTAKKTSSSGSKKKATTRKK